MARTGNSELNYRIKLLAGHNVVLVECNNFEPEIFSPQIVNGRITFLNIIPNRRCCQISKTNVINFAKRELVQSRKSSTEHCFLKRKNFAVLSANEEFGVRSPLANSTPAAVKQRHGCSSQLYSGLSDTNSTLPTPEAVRRAPPSQSMLENPMAKMPRVVKISRIYHNPVEGTPKKVGRVVIPSNSVSSCRNSAQDSILDGSYRLPCSPTLPTHSNNANLSNNLLHSTPVDCIERWSKVLTPVRTYSRKTNKFVTLNRTKNMEDSKNHKTTYKITPTYLYNPTQGLNVSQQIEIKKCKLIKDRKTSISPRTFKRQQNESLDAYSIKSNISLYPCTLSFHKPRSYLETMSMSAFDLLTSSNRKRVMARKLNEQFRKGCVNKASSTYIKYKILSSVPPIQQDEQVLQLRRISLEASQVN